MTLLERRRLVAAFLDGGVRADDAFGARELFIDARDFGGRRRGIGDERGDERVVARGDGLQTSLQRGVMTVEPRGAARRLPPGANAPDVEALSPLNARDDACDDDARRRVEAVGRDDATGETRRRPRIRPHDHDHDAPTRSVHRVGPSSPARCHPRRRAKDRRISEPRRTAPPPRTRV